MDHLFNERYGRPDPEDPWPGLVLGIDSDQGKAMLATPNSLGVAYRRQPNVHFFTMDGDLCLLWDLVPV